MWVPHLYSIPLTDMWVPLVCDRDAVLDGHRRYFLIVDHTTFTNYTFSVKWMPPTNTATLLHDFKIEGECESCDAPN